MRRAKEGDQVEQFWSQAGRPPTFDNVISGYASFAETPVAFNSDGKSIFDTSGLHGISSRRNDCRGDSTGRPLADAAHEDVRRSLA
jgi:hypothetical protein